jgi:hypothetical protein
MRSLLGVVVSWAALKLAELAARLLPKPPPAPLDTRRIPERYVRELVRLDLVQTDAVLGCVLGAPVFFDGYGFAKIPDTRWRQ